MITKQQLNIFQKLAQSPFKSMTITQLKEITKTNSNNAMTRAIKRFEQEQLITITNIGNAKLIALNVNNPQTWTYMSMQEHNFKDITTLIRNQMPTQFYSIILFGSHANNKAKKNSDIDLAILIESEHLRKQTQRALKAVKLKTPKRIDVHVITAQELNDMLEEKKANLGKELLNNHKILHNPGIFYAVIRRWIPNYSLDVPKMS